MGSSGLEAVAILFQRHPFHVVVVELHLARRLPRIRIHGLDLASLHIRVLATRIDVEDIRGGIYPEESAPSTRGIFPTIVGIGVEDLGHRRPAVGHQKGRGGLCCIDSSDRILVAALSIRPRQRRLRTAY